MKIIFIIIIFNLISGKSIGQDKIKFSSQNYIGLLEGESGSKLAVETINGIKYKTWFAAIGSGIDWYYQRSIPLFAFLSRDFLGKEKRNFYLSAAGGLNFPWKNNIYYYDWGNENDKLSAGMYWATGLGYKVGVGKNSDAILMHIGYSYKRISQKGTAYIYPCFDYPCPQGPDKYDFNLRRLSLKFGWSFN